MFTTGHSISVIKGQVFIDGIPQDGLLSGVVEIRVLEGSIGELQTDASVTCGAVTGVASGATHMTLVRVVAPHFVAGLEIGHGSTCDRAAPILSWAVGKPRDFLSAYFRRKGWRATIVPEPRTWHHPSTGHRKATPP